MSQQQLPPTNVENQVNPQQQMVMVRQTASGFEQGIAGVAGLLTAGPIGALAAWGAIRGLQGKWLPWFVLGIPAAPILGVLQLGMGIGGLSILGTMMDSTPSYTPPVEESRSYTPPTTNDGPVIPEVKEDESLTPLANPAPSVSSSTCFSTVFTGSDGSDSKAFGCDVSNPRPGYVNVTWDDGVKSTFINYTNGMDEVKNVKTGHVDQGTISYVYHEGQKYMHFESTKGGESWIPVTNMNYGE